VGLPIRLKFYPVRLKFLWGVEPMYDAALAWKSVLAALALNLISSRAHSLVFPDYPIPDLLAKSPQLAKAYFPNTSTQSEYCRVSVAGWI
jgi:hypothetical protein